MSFGETHTMLTLATIFINKQLKPMSKQPTIVILNAKPGDQEQAQIISGLRSEGYDLVAGYEDSTYIFVPDADVPTNDDQTVKGSLIQISNQTDRELRSKGFKHTANALSRNALPSLESHVKTKAAVTDQLSGVDWETLNNLQHMKEASSI